jgi:ligand-binding sensor domain-containing protein/serine phosphatase RsbU (regulator of sigma subunit)
MPSKFKQIIIVTGLLIYTVNSFTQEYRVNNYGVSEGISHPFVYTINQDSKGYIWIGTGEGLCQFNGFVFNTSPFQDSLANQVAGVSFKDSRDVLWFGYHSGDIAKYDGRRFEMINTGIDINSAITGIDELADGRILISTLNNGLFSLDAKTGKADTTEGLPQGMYTSVIVKGNTMLLGSQDGLSICSIDNAGRKASALVNVSELEFVKIQDIEPSYASNTYWIGTEDKGVFHITINGDKYILHNTGTVFKLGEENVQAVFEDQEKHLWVSSLRNGLFKLEEPDGNGDFKNAVVFNKENGLPGNAIKKVFQDLEGNIWIATYGDGLSMLTGQPMIFTELQAVGLDNDIQSIAVAPDKTYFIGGRGGLFRFRKGIDKQPVKIKSIPSDVVTSLLIEGKDLYIGTENNGLFLMDMKGNSVRKISYEAYSMGNWISSIALNSKHIFLGTKDGIYQLSRDFKEEAHFTTTNGMPHNNIEHVFLDSKNRLLFATRANGIYYISESGEIHNLFSTGNGEIQFKSITEDENGNIWSATYGDGVVFFKDDSVYQFTIPSGLKANFCYSIIKGSGNSIWVGHRLGISRINTSNNRISIYDQNVGITGDCNVNAAYTDHSGVVYIGTSGGLISYDPSQDKRKQLPPFTNIVNLLISDKEYDFNNDIVLPYKAYKVRIEFIGLNYSDPQAVRYQYKLEGYDTEWSDVTSQTSVTYSRIEEGEYTFYLRSYNSEGLSQEIPLSFKIKIKPPIWKTWWFITLLILFISLLFYIIMKIREEKQRKLQEYLERELIARTKEVVEQKEEIEIKNRDITDSINYAKRIQTSMLPPVKRLQHHFSGSFVFYHPRDIVSGDFYWFDQVNDNKFTIVCADSTGHGVPGAFMSMIGSTLIKDICNREAGNSPCKVLQVLDCELRNTLNQNLDDGTKPGDGMDIIVCEIDLKTHYVRFASAMRPMIIYRNGEEIFIKGSRNSVGGHYDKEDNIFEDEGLQLSKGDIIYMFSDGYSDQFGGPMGKKFKMVRLKNLLQDIHTKPMDEQCIHVKNTFNLWKENYEQVDDVLFMGIKI